MSFVSFQFIPFLAVILAVYYFLSKEKQNILLLVAGYVFYGASDYRLLILIIFSSMLDYGIGLRMSRTPKLTSKRLLLGISLLINLGILCFFKYANFIIPRGIDLLSLVGIHLTKPVLEILMPVGISFYTFKTVSYILDVYREQQKPCTKFIDYALYVSFFPQLASGPIERASSLLPQIECPRTIDKTKIIEGLWLMLWGFYKKMVIADNLAISVNRIFDPGVNVTGFQVLLGVYAFAFQVYCDFSGYTDIARGLARLMGFQTPLNFDLPYISHNPVEFWKRWHISLSTWLRDYIFLPIVYWVMRHIKKPALNLKVENWGYISGIFLTMLIGGIWHGGTWTFALWGAYHGLWLAVHHIMTRTKKKKKRKTPLKFKRTKHWLKIIGTFHLVCLGWLFFRANDFEQVGMFLKRLVFEFSIPLYPGETVFPLLLYVPMLLIFEIWIKNSDDPRRSPGWNILMGPIAVSVIILAILLLSSPNSGFIYAQF